MKQIVFEILRAYDEHAAPDVDTVRQLTRKVAIFFNDQFVITVHRAEQRFLEDANSLLRLTLAAADHETTQVTRVLTIFAAFFLPPTFIVGIYGMNFDVMPELRWRYGYPAVLLAMSALSAAIYLWFRRKGWM